MKRPLRIANCSGFYGDRLSAAREMVEGGPVDVLTGDYLAELTLFLLWKARQKQPGLGYAVTFLRQMEEVLAVAVQRGVRIVTNAGGLNPAGLAVAVRELASRLGVRVAVAHIEGDDLRDRLSELLPWDGAAPPSADGPGPQPVTAHAYLGAWGIAAALESGADVVVCPRVADASLVLGPAAWHFGWSREDWDELAGATVAGHVLECGAQATGGNYAFLEELDDPRVPGFPIAEVDADGSCVITKHPGTGGRVTRGTVTAQLVYEIAGPAYATPDVVARFDTICIEDRGGDRVAISGVRGEPAPDRLKVAVHCVGGHRNSVTFVLTGLDVEAKADRVRRQLFERLGGEDHFDAVDVQLWRADRPDPATNQEAGALLRITVKHTDPARVGRGFSAAAVELALSSVPGLYATTPPGDASSFGVFRAAGIPAAAVDAVVVQPDGSRQRVPHTRPMSATVPVEPAPAPAVPVPAGAGARRPLGTVVGARSGDKGGDANLGVWARSDSGYAWLASFLTVERLQELLPETAGLDVRRHELPNLRAMNFVILGLLGEGVAASVRFDPQAKSLGEWLRARVVELPAALLADAPGAPRP